MPSFSVRCSKCNTMRDGDYESVFAYMAALRVQGWQIPDAIENLPILCSTCKDATRTPNQP